MDDENLEFVKFFAEEIGTASLYYQDNPEILQAEMAQIYGMKNDMAFMAHTFDYDYTQSDYIESKWEKYSFPLQTDKYLNVLARDCGVTGLSNPAATACNFMSCLKLASDKSGISLFKLEIINIAVSAYNALSPNFKNEKTLGDNYWVGDIYDMINRAMEYLKSDIRVLSANKDNADCSLVIYKTPFNSSSRHFVAGDNLGNPCYDPDPSLNENYKLTNYDTYYFRWSK